MFDTAIAHWAQRVLPQVSRFAIVFIGKPRSDLQGVAQEAMPTAETALPGRETAVPLHGVAHAVFGNPVLPPYPEGFEVCVFGNGCFWGPEVRYWELPGVWSTAVGYCGGLTPNPSYEEVCSGQTGHNEVCSVALPLGATAHPLHTIYTRAHSEVC
jgi:peptide-methionine (S)-S-oxide reductase